MDTPPENPTPPPSTESTPPPSPGPTPFADNQYAKQYMSNPYGQMGTTHPADMPIAIIIIIFGGLGALLMLFTGLLGGAVSAAGAGSGSGVVAGAGGLIMLYSIIGLVCSVGSIIGAVGMLKAARWGFMIVGAFGLIGAIIGLLHFNPISLIVGAAQAVYCGMRITGQLGGKPL